MIFFLDILSKKRIFQLIIAGILTIFAGFSFNNDTNGIGFLLMAIFCLISTLLIYFRGYILK